MADKTPVRVVFNASNVATGLAEFQSGDTVGTAFGGTGLTSIGSAGQVLKVNAAGNGLEFGAEGDISITNLVAPSNADLTFSTSGTGNIVLDAITLNGTTLSAADSTKITVAEALDVTGALVAGTSLNIAGDGATVTGIKDEDNMASNSATKLATQQSIKAYVDSEISGISSTAISQNDSNVTVADSGSGTITVTVDGSTIGTFNSSGLQLGTSGARVTTVLDEDNLATNSNTALATQQSIKAYVDAQITAEDLDFQADSGGALSIDLDSETMTFTGGTGIDTSGSGNTVTFAIDSTVATLTGSQTLTNKVLDSATLNTPVIRTPTIQGAATIGEITTNAITSNGSNADLSIQPSGTGDVLISALRVNGTTLDSSDSTKITIAEAVDITGALTFSGFTLPTSDGTDGQALVTDGSKTLSFGTVGAAPVSDDSAASVVNDKMIRSTARTIDSFHTTFQDSVLYYVVSNDFNEDAINVQKVSVCHNDSASFISSAGIQSKASTTMTAFTTSVDNSMVRVKAASSNAVGGSLSFYKFGLGDNTSTGTSNNVIISQNTDVDSASESLVTFAHADFRGAKLFISINNNSKTEVGNTEALVVHDGTNAFISQFGGIQSGNQPMLTLTAAISGSNVVVSAAGNEPNLRVTVHAIMLKDTMTSNDGSFSNAEAIAPVTISSSATAVDELVETTANGAVYYLVSKNASEGEYAVNEVFLALGSGEITVASTGFVSTKGTNQLGFTADYKDDVENTGRLLVSSTSGGSTTVSAYRINALAK